MDRYTAIFGLTPSERAALDEAIRITNAREHITPDDCQNCGGHGCPECQPCDCSRCKAYVPDYIRDSVKNWRPAS